jgi:hypothetical protein
MSCGPLSFPQIRQSKVNITYAQPFPRVTACLSPLVSPWRNRRGVIVAVASQHVRTGAHAKHPGAYAEPPLARSCAPGSVPALAPTSRQHTRTRMRRSSVDATHPSSSTSRPSSFSVPTHGEGVYAQEQAVPWRARALQSRRHAPHPRTRRTHTHTHHTRVRTWHRRSVGLAVTVWRAVRGCRTATRTPPTHKHTRNVAKLALAPWSHSALLDSCLRPHRIHTYAQHTHTHVCAQSVAGGSGVRGVAVAPPAQHAHTHTHPTPSHTHTHTHIPLTRLPLSLSLSATRTSDNNTQQISTHT